MTANQKGKQLETKYLIILCVFIGLASLGFIHANSFLINSVEHHMSKIKTCEELKNYENNNIWFSLAYYQDMHGIIFRDMWELKNLC